MLPTAHLGFTLAAWRLAQRVGRRSPAGAALGLPVDGRLLVLAALGPDLLDKPLAPFLYARTGATKLWGHTLLLHLLLVGGLWWWFPAGWVYGLAFSGHLLLDAIWSMPATFFWPAYGWRFHRASTRRRQLGFWRAYWVRLRSMNQIPWLELLGLLALLWVIVAELVTRASAKRQRERRTRARA